MATITPAAVRDARRQRRVLSNQLAHAEAALDAAELRILQLARQLEAVERVIGTRAPDA